MLSSFPAHAALVAEYRFDDVAWCTPVTARDTVGGRDGTLIGSVTWQDSPVAGGKPENGAAAGFSGGAIDIVGLPLDLTPGAVTSVSFWMYWDGTNSVMPIGFGLHDLWLQGGSFGFNSFNSDIFGIASAGLANGWHHVVAAFTNGNVAANKLWIDGVPQVLTQRQGSPNNTNAVVSSHMRLSGVWGNSGYRFSGMLDVVRIHTGLVTQVQVDADRALSNPAVACPPPPPPPPPTLVAQYKLDDNWDVTRAAVNTVSGGPAGNFLTPYAAKVATPLVSPNKPNTCFGAAFTTATGSMQTTGASLDLSGGGKNSVSFWMYWNGGNNQMPFGFAIHDLWLQGGDFGFNTGNSDIFGIASAGLANGWRHVAAVFTNGNVAANKLWIDGVPQVLTQRRGTPNNANAYAANTFQLSSWTRDNNYRFVGLLDELKVYRGALTDALVLDDYAATCVKPIAEYRMDEAVWNGTAGEITDSVAANNGRAMSGAVTGAGKICNGGNFAPANSYALIGNTSAIEVGKTGGDFSVAYWMRHVNTFTGAWRSLIHKGATNNDRTFAMWMYPSSNQMHARISTTSNWNEGINATTNPLALNAWTHVTYVKSGSSLRLYFNGVLDSQTTLAGTSISNTGPLYLGKDPWYPGFGGQLDEFKIFDIALAAADVAVGYANENSGKNWDGTLRPCSSGPHHIRIEHSGSGVTCTPATLTVKACADAACSTLHTGGVTGTLTATGTPTVNWVGGAGFSIGASGSTTKQVQVTTAGMVTWGTTGAAPAPANATSCYVGATASCGFTSALAGFLFDVPDHLSGDVRNITVRAVRQADNNLACTPAFDSGSRTINFNCAYSDPASGTLPVIVGGNSVACGTASGVSLSFTNGVASTTVQYADVGKLSLTANYTGSGGSETGLVMNGSDIFIAAPASFAVVPSGPYVAGSAFGVTVTAKNVLGGTTPNFGRESSTENVTLSGTLVGPAGGNNPALQGTTTLADASFQSGGGMAAANDIKWGEVGDIDVVATLASGSYLGSGLSATGSGAAGPFKPAYLVTELDTTQPCGTFTYSGQPFRIKVTAKQADAVTTTQNYTGSYAKAVTLGSDGASACAPTITGYSNNTLAAADFTAAHTSTPGAVSTAPMGNTAAPLPIAYVQALGPPTPVTVCAKDADGVNSHGQTQAVLAIRSGVLRLSNAYGSELLGIRVPVRALYCNAASAGNCTDWRTNASDTCTSFAAGNASLGDYQGTLAAGNFAIAGHWNAAQSRTSPIGTGSGVSPGTGVIAFNRPTCAAAPCPQGSVDLTLTVPVWLQGGSGTPWPQNPVSRLRFGSPKAPYIYLRERY